MALRRKGGRVRLKAMKKGKLWSISPVVVLLAAALVVSTGATFFLNRTVFYVEAVLVVFTLGLGVWRFAGLKRDIHRYLMRISGQLDQTSQDALASFPLPVAVGSSQGEVLWYNDSFRNQVLDGTDAFGDPLETIMGNLKIKELQKKRFVDIQVLCRSYTVYISPVRVRESTLYILYYIDNTRLKEIAEEYALSRPAVMMVYIDNIEEVMQNIRDSERAQITGRVETILENWIGSTTGILRKYGSDRFMIILEQRHLDGIIEGKFDILDRVRAIQTSDHISVTLSIGVGQGETLKESEDLARQAIEMALGRGGDQAAVKTKNGFDFYGGVSKGVEKRTKVRTRVVASALQELVAGSENVLVMGHRFSDLDCLGSAVGMAAAVRNLGKPAYVVTQRDKTLARELMERYDKADRSDMFIEPDTAMNYLSRKTLLIVTDTHNPNMLDWPPLYQRAETVVVIDHHRKMVEHIDNAVIFYHEPYSSSASEMVAELVQYMGQNSITRLEAEALLAGIMLDTRSFVMKAGVRTFEAAAYLRRQGADTVEVKRMFSESAATYRKKADIISRAELYKHTAIACDTGGGQDIRIAAAQAADELLSIKGVDASFTLFEENGGINISARSLGNFNVQLVMEAIGGGGHLTMAGAYLKEKSMEQARELLVRAIDAHLEERERSLQVQLTQSDRI